ncbi:MAG: tRNA lysidine(34) synthetase TilS [Pseudodonghicola sp.]
MTAADSEILHQVRGAFGATPPDRLGVALSGGGDSVALLHLLTRCFTGAPVRLFAATVDHGLRPEAAAEAAEAGRLAEALGVPHSVLRWQGWDGGGNLQDAARQARYRLLGGWARGQGIGTLAVGHTADDQAETLLMRLGRASGVAGLSGMAPRRMLEEGVMLARPLLAIGRQELRAYLRRQGLSWAEDPSNLDDRFARVRARCALEALAPLGITPTALSDVARNMARADQALGWAAFQAAGDLARIEAGCVVLQGRGLALLAEEITRRLLAAAIGWIGGQAYPPRRAPMEHLLADLRQGGGGTLAGCRVLSRRGEIWICREYNAVRDLRAAPGARWDRRWLLAGAAAPGAEVGALGPEGLAQCADRAATGLPRAALEASPALWQDGRLVAAPLAGSPNGWHAILPEGEAAFRAALLSH